MAKPRVMIADEDASYITPLQIKFVKDYFQQVDLEIITDRIYFEELFSNPQKIEILIVSEKLYNSSLQRHNIANIFVMTEQKEGSGSEDLNVNRLFKYTSIKEIFHEIEGKSTGVFRMEGGDRKETQIVLVTSANGGAGKTTIAMGMSACLTRNYQRVLYINASRLQCFQHMFDNDTPLSSPEVYMRLASPTEQIYGEIRHTIRKEMFSYLPAFKAALMSVGLEYATYGRIALSAKKSGDFDFIVIDAESTFDEDKTKLFDLADRVIVVTEQSVQAVHAANALVSNIKGTNTDKYVFVCNKFEKERANSLIVPNIALKFNVNDYIEQMEDDELEDLEHLSNSNGIQKLSFLIL